MTAEKPERLGSLLMEIGRQTQLSDAEAALFDRQELDGTMETLHLLSSPKNAERLRRSIADAEAGNLEFHNLVDP